MTRSAVSTVRGIRAARRWLYASPEELERHQLDRLNRVFQAATSTKAYRDRYGSGAPVRLERLTDLREVPVIERAHLESYDVDDRMSERPTDPVFEPSTGTSGVVFVSARSRAEAAYQVVLTLRQASVQGLRPGGRRMELTFGADRRGPLRMHGNLGRVGAYAPVDEQVRAIRSIRPHALGGPPSILLEIGETAGRIPVQLLGTFGEFLGGSDRQVLREAFDTNPLDLYAASEVGNISWECRSRSGYHINADAVIVEILDPDGRPLPPGEPGDVVVTALWNRTAPIIRYRLFDVGALLPEPCPCGITLPLMGQVEGRVSDRPVALDGDRVSPLRFLLGNVGPFHDSIRRYRVIQREVDDLLVEVVWKDRPAPEFRDLVRDAFSRALHGPVRVEVRDLPRLSTPRGQKFRLVQSLVGEKPGG